MKGLGLRAKDSTFRALGFKSLRLQALRRVLL